MSEQTLSSTSKPRSFKRVVWAILEWQREQGNEPISLNPHTVVETWQRLARPA